MVGGINNQSKDQVPTSWVLLFRVQENKQTVPMDGVWGHKDNTSLLRARAGPRNISENIEMTVTRSPSYLEVTLKVTEWLKCSEEEERYTPIP